jgi:hypothetical protein
MRIRVAAALMLFLALFAVALPARAQSSDWGTPLGLVGYTYNVPTDWQSVTPPSGMDAEFKRADGAAVAISFSAPITATNTPATELLADLAGFFRGATSAGTVLSGPTTTVVSLPGADVAASGAVVVRLRDNTITDGYVIAAVQGNMVYALSVILAADTDAAHPDLAQGIIGSFALTGQAPVPIQPIIPSGSGS